MVSWSAFSVILPWALPPLLGAIIGYATNSIAIRMLFRPLRRWRLLGMPIPFTPGVIPRRRGELAQSIGRMVARELLTEEVFRARLSQPNVRRMLQGGIVELIDRAAATTPAHLDAELPMTRLIHDAIDAAALLLCREQDRIADSVAHAAAPLLEELAPIVRRTLLDARPLAGLSRDEINSAMIRAWPGVAQRGAEALRSPRVRAIVTRRARSLVRYALDQLSDLQRLFVTVAQYERTLEAKMPQIVDRALSEAVATLESTDTRDLVSERIMEWVEANRDRTVEMLAGEHAPTLADRVVDRFLARWRQPDELRPLVAALMARSCEGIAPWLHRRFDEFFARAGTRSFGELLPVLRRRRASIGRALAGPAQAGLVAAAGAFVERLDVYSVVVDRIDSLDVERVEGLLLGIIRRHLRWINAFGALLGALIGAIQILLRLIPGM